MLIIGLTVILNLYIGGLNDLSTDVDLASEEDYRQAMILENLLNYDPSPSETEVEYDQRRAVMAVDLISNEDPGEDEAGFQTNNNNCYIDGVTGLDGEEFAFGVQVLSDITENAEDPEPIRCRYTGTEDSIWSPALIKRENNPPIEVILHVYAL